MMRMRGAGNLGGAIYYYSIAGFEFLGEVRLFF